MIEYFWDRFMVRPLVAICLELLLLTSCAPATEVVAPKPVLFSPGSGEVIGIKQGLYRHPSGAFALLPLSDEFEEGQNYVIFHGETATVDASFSQAGEPINDANALDVASTVLDELLIQSGKAVGFEITNDVPEAANRGYVVFFQISPTQGNDTFGSLYIRREGEILYTVLMTTADYAALVDLWRDQIESFRSGVDLIAGQPWLGVGETATPETEGIFGLSTEDADSGFRPELNGFNFANYGNSTELINLTIDEVQRMFGEQVCASLLGGECMLTPAAREWMDLQKNGMESGHSEGMAVLSVLMYHGIVDPEQFGGSNAAELELSSQLLQREIAYWWATQNTFPGISTRINESPRDVVHTLLDAFTQGDNALEWWTLGIYQQDGSGGHSLTPIAVDDRGDGIFKILVYDSDFPGEVQIIDLDSNANTWSYQNPNDPGDLGGLYQGDASTRTLEAVAISPRMSYQRCDFCQEKTNLNGAGNGSAANLGFYEIWLQGEPNFLINDQQGRRLGYVEDEYIKEIPEATIRWLKNGRKVGDEKNKPVYRIPVSESFEIAANGDQMKESGQFEVSVIGPGHFFSIGDIWLEPDGRARITIEGDGKRFRLIYTSNTGGSPVVMLGLETEQADYAFLVRTAEPIETRAAFDIAIDLETGEFILNTRTMNESSKYAFSMLRISEQQGEEAFGVAEMVIQPNDTIYYHFLGWGRDGGFMTARIDRGNDGVIDETLELPDELDTFTWME